MPVPSFQEISTQAELTTDRCSTYPSKIDFTAIWTILPNGAARPQTNWRRLKVSYSRCKSQILKRIHPKLSSPWIGIPHRTQKAIPERFWSFSKTTSLCRKKNCIHSNIWYSRCKSQTTKRFHRRMSSPWIGIPHTPQKSDLQRFW
jgi:hypothetical protein